MISFFDLLKHIEGYDTFVMRDFALSQILIEEIDNPRNIDTIVGSWDINKIHTIATRLFCIGQFNEALKELSRIWALKATDFAIGIRDSSADVDMAICEVYVNGYLAAKKRFEEIENKARDDNYFIKRAILEFYWGEKKQKNGLDILKKGLEINPKNREGLNLFALWSEDSKNSIKSIHAYEDLTNIFPDYDMGYVDYGAFLADMNKAEEALHLFDKALEINPFNHEACFRKGKVLEAVGNDDESKKLILKAIVYCPQRPSYHGALGSMALKTGHVKDNLGKVVSELVDEGFFSESALSEKQKQLNWGRYYRCSGIDFTAAFSHFNSLKLMDDKEDLPYFEIAHTLSKFKGDPDTPRLFEEFYNQGLNRLLNNPIKKY